MDRKAVSMWKVTRNLILTDVCAIALYWLIPSAKMLVLPLGVLCAIGYMLWLGRCFLNDCKANLPNEDYQRIAAYFGFVGVSRLSIAKQWQYITEEAGENGQILLNMWRCRALFIIASFAEMLVLLYNYS